MKIAIEGASKLDGSYGIVNMNLAVALGALGADVTVSPWDQSEESCAAQLASAFPGAGVAVSCDAQLSFDVRVRQIWPPNWSRPSDGSKLVVVQPWEFGSLPLAWLDGVQAADAVWAYSSYVKAGYVQSGVPPKKVWVVPAGSDLATSAAPSKAGRGDGNLSLLFVGGGIFRKGVDILVSSLDKLPPDQLARLALTIKETGHGSYYRGQSLVDSALKGAPRVAAVTNVVREHMEREQLKQLMLSSDVLVHPYRSEGFGLPVIEAMALGLPVIVTKGGATDDFCGPDEAVGIPADLTVTNTPFIGDMMTLDFPYFLTPRADDLTRAIATAVTGEADLSAKRLAAWERSREYSWAKVAVTALSALEAVMEGRHASDIYSDAEQSVQAFLRQPGAEPWEQLSSQLREIGDRESATRVLQIARARGSGPQAGSALRHALLTGTGQADLWSAAPWRLDIVAACREHGDVPAVVHRHEGDDGATSLIANSIAPYFSACRTVLDLGCGQGSMLRTLRSLGKKVIGVEGDPVLVARLRDEGFDVRHGWVPQVLEDLDVTDVDGLFLGHVIEHLNTAEALRVLRWAASRLNDNAVVVVQTPDFSVDFVSKTNFWVDPTHIRPYPVLLLKGMLESAGFAPLAGGCRPLGPQAPLDLVAVGRLRRPATVEELAPEPVAVGGVGARARRRARLLHLGLFGSDSGMGHASRGLLDTAALSQQDIEVVRVDVAANEGAELPEGTYPFAEALGMYADLAVIDVPIGWLPEVLPKVRAGQRILRFAFEAFPLPGYISDAMKGTDEIWAMSHYAAEAALASGTGPSLVHIIPPSLGEGWEIISGPEGAASAARERSGARAFSSVFNFEPRKNPEALVRAFRELLKKGLSVKLYLKTSGIDDENFWAWALGVLGQRHFDQFKGATKLFTQRFRDDQVRKLVEASDVFVLPTRGEGFGLPFLEAMARGIPVVCPDVGGHRDFCDDETSFLVRSRSVPCVAHWDIPLFRESRWQEVDFDGLVEAMTTAATDPEQLAKKAHASLLRAEDFTRADPRSLATRRVLELLQRHDRAAGSEPSAHFAPPADDGSIMAPPAERSPRKLPQVVRS